MHDSPTAADTPAIHSIDSLLYSVSVFNMFGRVLVVIRDPAMGHEA